MILKSILWRPFQRFRPSKDQDVPKISGIDYSNVVSAFEDAGFWVVGEGVHVVMTDGRRILTIPRNDPVHALTMAGLVRDSGLTIEKFRELL